MAMLGYDLVNCRPRILLNSILLALFWGMAQPAHPKKKYPPTRCKGKINRSRDDDSS